MTKRNKRVTERVHEDAQRDFNRLHSRQYMQDEGDLPYQRPRLNLRWVIYVILALAIIYVLLTAALVLIPDATTAR